MSSKTDFNFLRTSILVSGDALAWDEADPPWFRGGGWDEFEFWEQIASAMEDGRLRGFQRRCDGSFPAVWSLLRPQIQNGQFDGTIAAWSQTAA